jgi:hypothetical protein
MERVASAQGCHDGILKGPTLLHEVVPPLQVGQFGMMDIERIPPMNRRRGWNIPDGKALTGEKGTIRKTGIEYLCGSKRQAFGP